MKNGSRSFILLASFIISQSIGIGGPFFDGTFESIHIPWSLFVPSESASDGCELSVSSSLTHSGHGSALLSSKGFARYGICPDGAIISVGGGERYRLTAWVRPGDNFQVAPDTPGVVLRATLYDGARKDFSGGHIFAGFDGVAISDPKVLHAHTLPQNWSKLECVIEIPQGAHEMVFFVFCWKTSGHLFIDDISAEKVGGEVPLTPITH